MLTILLLLLPITKAWMIGLFVFVLACGAGGGTVVSPMFAELFGMKSHGLIIGFGGLISGFGAAFGPVVAGYIFDNSGNYQLAFILCGASVAASLALATFLRPMNIQARNRIISS